MDKTTVLDLNKPAKNDFTSHWDVPINENADLIDANVLLDRAELTGQSVAPITSYLKGTAGSLADRLNISLNADGTLSFNNDDLEKSRYSGLENRVTDPYDDIHKRMEALEERLLLSDETNALTGQCSLLTQRVRRAWKTWSPGAEQNAVSSNLRYQDNLTVTIVGTVLRVVASADQEFVLGGKIFVLKSGRSLDVEMSSVQPGVLYVQGWGGDPARTGSNPAGGYIAEGPCAAVISTSVITVTLALGILTDVTDGDVMVVETGAGPTYRYKVKSVSGSDITIYGKLPMGFSASVDLCYIVRMTEPKFYFVPTGSVTAESGEIIKHFNTDRGSTVANQWDRQAIAYCDGIANVDLLPPRIHMGNTELIVGGNGGVWNSATSGYEQKNIPLITHDMPLQVRDVIPFVVGQVDSGNYGALVFNPKMAVPIGYFGGTYSTEALLPLLSADITYPYILNRTFDGNGFVNVTRCGGRLTIGTGAVDLKASVGSTSEVLDLFLATTFWGVALIY